jgi:SulP family sulfate permease
VGELCEALKHSGIEVIFARVNRYLRADMDRHGITPIVEARCIFSTLHEALRMAGVDKPDDQVKGAP